MPVLPTLSQGVKFVVEPSRARDKTVDHPNAFHRMPHPRIKRQVISLTQNQSLTNSRASKKFSCINQNGMFVNEGYRPMHNSRRYGNTPANTDPICGMGGKELILPIRKICAKNVSSLMGPTTMETGHVGKRYNGNIYENHFGSTGKEYSPPRSETTTKGKRVPGTPSMTKSKDMISFDNARASTRFQNTRRFDAHDGVVSVARNYESQSRPQTGRDGGVFRRTASTLDGVFYPTKAPTRMSKHFEKVSTPAPFYLDY